MAAAVLALGVLAAGVLATAGAARAADYVPGEVLIGYPATTELLRLPRGTTVSAAISHLRHQHGVSYAVPNYIAHAAGTWIPNDPGPTRRVGGWQSLQWNFLASTGVNAPEAWSNLIAVRHPGGQGVVIAILDTGVAYRNW